MQISRDLYNDLVAKGFLKPPGNKGKRAKGQQLVPFACDPRGIFTLPIKTVSEANSRDWHGRSSRTGTARKIVSGCLGKHLRTLTPVAEHYHAGHPVAVRLTRMGGAKLDLCNLPTSMKAVEDALALMLGADDGSPLWRVSFHQEPGGPMGVRIELALS